MPPFQVVEDSAPTAPAQSNLAAQKMLLFALGSLSKRAIAGVSAAFSLLGVASVWFLWYTVLPDPTVPKLIGVGMYSVFLLVLELIRKRNSE